MTTRAALDVCAHSWRFGLRVPRRPRTAVLALALVAEVRPSVVITDGVMPAMSGS